MRFRACLRGERGRRSKTFHRHASGYLGDFNIRQSCLRHNTHTYSVYISIHFATHIIPCLVSDTACIWYQIKCRLRLVCWPTRPNLRSVEVPLVSIVARGRKQFRKKLASFRVYASYPSNHIATPISTILSCWGDEPRRLSSTYLVALVTCQVGDGTLHTVVDVTGLAYFADGAYHPSVQVTFRLEFDHRPNRNMTGAI